ncbi:MAG: type IV toxin-antitoxin system AbiEi family antitoxin domain-containing protein [Pseudonocardiaceae bacterium]
MDHDRLYQLAKAQAGCFTTRQVVAAGMDRSTLGRAFGHDDEITHLLDSGQFWCCLSGRLSCAP